MRLPLILLLLVAVCTTSVFGGSQSRAVKLPPLPAGHPTAFPSHHQLATDTDLARRYTGDNKLNVHLVPHTHDDVGWLKTVDQYFLGANNSIQHAGVKYILDTVVEELMKNSSRKFIYVEQAFFQTWWVRQTSARQGDVKKLVANGQLEFINGGWCMHDEATTHYLDMVDQTTLGHQYLLQQFDVTPTVGWQIDPFGHSSTQASLLSGVVGFDALFFGRIDHEDHDQRMKAKNMEFVWRPSPSLGEEGAVFSGAFQSGNYGPPDGFCFDWFCGDAPIIDDERFIDYNVPDRVAAFLNQINNQAAFTKGNNLMITMGSDFQYENAREWFENLDKLIDIINKDGRINMFYSTPSAYVAAKNAEGLNFTVKTDDFFPYSDDDDSYWTGYYTSRPALKRYVRASSALLQAARQIEVLVGGDGDATMPLAQAVGVAQHHDAVAGTAKQHVAFDYAQRIHLAQVVAQDMMADGLASLTVADHPDSVAASLSFCELANISVCAATTLSDAVSSGFQVLFYNPLARSREELVSVPVSDTEFVVTNASGSAVQAQVTQVHNATSHTSESASLLLHFVASVPALGYATYFVAPAGQRSQVFHESRHLRSSSPTARRRRAAAEAKASTFVSAVHVVRPESEFDEDDDDIDLADPIVLANDAVSLTFDGSTGMVYSFADVSSGVKTRFGVEFASYSSYVSDHGQQSGAYIFRPATQQPPTPVVDTATLLVQRGPVVQEATQLLSPWVNATYRLSSIASWVEVLYSVGPLPVDLKSGVGREVVVQYQTMIASNASWSSDSNAREMVPRVRNYRESYQLNVTQPIAGNYVPFTAAAFLNDGSVQLTVLTDRAQGVTSLDDGVLEVMVHRRTLADDARGVGEPLNETADISPYPSAERSGAPLAILGTHYLLLGEVDQAAAAWRPLMQRVYQPLVPLFGEGVAPADIPAYAASRELVQTFLGGGDDADVELAPNIDLVSFASWSQWTGSNRTLLVRLAHQFAVGEDAHWSQPAQVDLATLFTKAPTQVQQVSLTATRKIDDTMPSAKKLKWNTIETEETRNLAAPEHVPIAGTVVTINPMEILTFILTF